MSCNSEKAMNSLERQGRSKYYLGYSKPPLVDMRWENCDINVAEQANILKFSKLDNIGTLSDILNHSLMNH